MSSDSENDDEVQGSSSFHSLPNHCSAAVVPEPFSSSPKSFTSNTSMVSNDSTFTNPSVDRFTTHVTESPALTGRFSSTCDACVLDCFFDLACWFNQNFLVQVSVHCASTTSKDKVDITWNAELSKTKRCERGRSVEEKFLHFANSRKNTTWCQISTENCCWRGWFARTSCWRGL